MQFCNLATFAYLAFTMFIILTFAQFFIQTDDMNNRPHLEEPRYIMIASHKGGVGKSTISALSALYLAKKGYRVEMDDWDANDTTTRFLAQISKAGVENIKAHRTKSRSFDYLIIDTPGNVQDIKKAKTIFHELDSLVIVSDASIDAIVAMSSMISLAKEHGILDRVVLLFNAIKKGTDDYKQALKDIDSFKQDFPDIQSFLLPHSVTYKKAKESCDYSKIKGGFRVYFEDFADEAIDWEE